MQQELLDQIENLRQRLMAERFQVAVLGQFKRGKSTLLNALLGTSLLPTAVVPLTAIATYLQSGPNLSLHIVYQSGQITDERPKSAEGACDRLQALVTESGNPANSLNVARVDVTVPSALLDQGVVLIDTPGIGSTYSHNSTTAYQMLPKCDACLFVLSPDPPITEVELAYLGQIKKNVTQIVVVLNKMDTVEADDRVAALEFLRRVLTEQAGLGTTPIFCVSARTAIRARAGGDLDMLEDSGLPQLEQYSTNFLNISRKHMLQWAIASKTAKLVNELCLEMQILLQSLNLPAEDLERRLAVFRDAERRFEIMRRNSQDLLSGDRERTLRDLDAFAAKLRGAAIDALREEIISVLAAGGDAHKACDAMTARSEVIFTSAQHRLTNEMRSRLTEVLREHQACADDLIDLVRRTATTLVDIPYTAPQAEEALAAKHEPHWAGSGRTETVIPITAGALDWLLPAAMRRARLGARLMAEAAVLVTRNVENLRWAMRRNLDDAFRQYGSTLDERLAATLQATKGAMETALEQRRRLGNELALEIASRQNALSRLGDIGVALNQFTLPES